MLHFMNDSAARTGLMLLAATLAACGGSGAADLVGGELEETGSETGSEPTPTGSTPPTDSGEPDCGAAPTHLSVTPLVPDGLPPTEGVIWVPQNPAGWSQIDLDVVWEGPDVPVTIHAEWFDPKLGITLGEATTDIITVLDEPCGHRVSPFYLVLDGDYEHAEEGPCVFDGHPIEIRVEIGPYLGTPTDEITLTGVVDMPGYPNKGTWEPLCP
jgi:hypothetical protein